MYNIIMYHCIDINFITCTVIKFQTTTLVLCDYIRNLFICVGLHAILLYTSIDSGCKQGLIMSLGNANFKLRQYVYTKFTRAIVTIDSRMGKYPHPSTTVPTRGAIAIATADLELGSSRTTLQRIVLQSHDSLYSGRPSYLLHYKSWTCKSTQCQLRRSQHVAISRQNTELYKVSMRSLQPWLIWTQAELLWDSLKVDFSLTHRVVTNILLPWWHRSWST